MLKKFLKLTTDDDSKDALNQMKAPKREPKGEMPSFQNFYPGFTNQGDVLIMPVAGSHKFDRILVVVDDHTKLFDAEPLIGEDSNKVLKALHAIYARKEYLKTWPKIFEFDAGSSFKGAVKTFCEKHNIRIRVAAGNRHRQQGLVESKNKILARVLFSYINKKALNDVKQKKEETGKKRVKVDMVTDWYVSNEHFRSAINLINSESKSVVYSKAKTDTPITTKNNETLLPVGSEVRVLLDTPKEIETNKRLHGKFRATDIRWSDQVYEIEWIGLYPGQPPLYRVENEKFLRTRQQLQLVKINKHGGFVNNV